MRYLTLILVACLLSLTSIIGDLTAQEATDGEMTFSVKTVTVNGKFSPKHVLAIWVEDDAGFVKTRKLRGDKRKQYLYTWNSNTGSNVTDATTGATLTSHQTHSVTWDCRDINGDIVPDGTYKVYVEFTEEHAQGPIHSVSFNKGADAVSVTPGDETNFKDITLSFEPVVVLSAAFKSDTPIVYPNPTNGVIMIELGYNSGISGVKIFDLKGTLLYAAGMYTTGYHFIDISEFASGVYVMQFDNGHDASYQMILKE